MPHEESRYVPPKPRFKAKKIDFTAEDTSNREKERILEIIEEIAFDCCLEIFRSEATEAKTFV